MSQKTDPADVAKYIFWMTRKQNACTTYCW